MTDIVIPTKARGKRAAKADPSAIGLERVAYTPREVAAMFGLSARTVYDMVQAGVLPAMRWGVAGRSIRILATDIAAWAERQRQDAADRLLKSTYFED